MDHECGEDDDAFEPSGLRVDNHTGNDTNYGKDGHQKEKPVVQRILHRAAEVDALGQRLKVATISTQSKHKALKLIIKAHKVSTVRSPVTNGFPSGILTWV